MTPSTNHAPRLITVLALSGFAGLAYEVLWTRMLGAVLGTDMMSVMGVVTGFFAGLGIGALLLDGPIGRARHAGRAYAWVEVAIAAWAIVSLWLIPAAGRALPALLGAAPGPVLLWAVGFGLPALLLLPATAAMGGTLVALERLTAALRSSGRVSGGVYGVNTAGAVLGTLAVVFVLLPNFGVSGTVMAMAVMNLACASIALGLGRGVPAAVAPPAIDRSGRGLQITLVLTGCLGIAFELLIVRLAAQVLQNTIITFALLLAAYLTGTAAGGFVWQRSGWAADARTRSALLAVTSLACTGTAAIILMAGPLVVAGADGFGVLAESGVVLALFLVPTTAMGAVFGCLLQAVRDRSGTVGRAVALNSLGAASGPAIASLVLIPNAGIWGGLLLVAAGYAAIALAGRWRPGWSRLSHASACGGCPPRRLSNYRMAAASSRAGRVPPPPPA